MNQSQNTPHTPAEGHGLSLPKTRKPADLQQRFTGGKPTHSLPPLGDLYSPAPNTTTPPAAANPATRQEPGNTGGALPPRTNGQPERVTGVAGNRVNTPTLPTGNTTPRRAHPALPTPNTGGTRTRPTLPPPTYDVAPAPTQEAPVYEAPVYEAPALLDAPAAYSDNEEYTFDDAEDIDAEETETQETGIDTNYYTTGRPPAGTHSHNIPPAAMVIDDGWEEDHTDDDEETTTNNKTFGYATNTRKLRITERDLDVIRFLARFRYAQGIQIARYVGTSRKSMDQRLTKLGKADLLRREVVTTGQSVWTPTQAGLTTADMDFGAIGAGRISPVGMGHTLGLVNIAIGLEQRHDNTLDLPGFEHITRINHAGKEVPGETLISEREIAQSKTRWKSYMDHNTMSQAHTRALQDWLNNPEGETPEFTIGNEAMLVLWSQRVGEKDHVPDLVVTRPRDPDGTPRSHAVELELKTKPMKEWERILEQYANDQHLYECVHYITHKPAIQDGILRAAERVGLLQQERIKTHTYRPVRQGIPFWG